MDLLVQAREFCNKGNEKDVKEKSEGYGQHLYTLDSDDQNLFRGLSPLSPRKLDRESSSISAVDRAPEKIRRAAIVDSMLKNPLITPTHARYHPNGAKTLQLEDPRPINTKPASKRGVAAVLQE